MKGGFLHWNVIRKFKYYAFFKFHSTVLTCEICCVSRKKCSDNFFFMLFVSFLAEEKKWKQKMCLLNCRGNFFLHCYNIDHIFLYSSLFSFICTLLNGTEKRNHLIWCLFLHKKKKGYVSNVLINKSTSISFTCLYA